MKNEDVIGFLVFALVLGALECIVVANAKMHVADAAAAATTAMPQDNATTDEHGNAVHPSNGNVVYKHTTLRNDMIFVPPGASALFVNVTLDNVAIRCVCNCTRLELYGCYFKAFRHFPQQPLVYAHGARSVRMVGNTIELPLDANGIKRPDTVGLRVMGDDSHDTDPFLRDFGVVVVGMTTDDLEFRSNEAFWV